MNAEISPAPIRRPVLIWILAIFLLLMTAGAFLLFALTFVRASGPMLRHPVLAICYPLAKQAAIGAMGIGLLLRWRWARYAAAVVFAGFAVFILLGFIRGPSSTFFADRSGISHDNPSYQSGLILGSLMFTLLLGAAAGSLIFDKSIGAYFRRTDRENP